jgi:integrase
MRRMQASLLYGTGMRLLEGLRLRVQDLDFDKNEIRVRRAKGGKDRVTVFPAPLHRPLRNHLEKDRLAAERRRSA